jgi:hypothetical protein
MDVTSAGLSVQDDEYSESESDYSISDVETEDNVAKAMSGTENVSQKKYLNNMTKPAISLGNTVLTLGEAKLFGLLNKNGTNKVIDPPIRSKVAQAKNRC